MSQSTANLPQGASKRERLVNLLEALGADFENPTHRKDGLTQTTRLNETDDVCITAAGEDTAVITIVCGTAAAIGVLGAVAAHYGIEAGAVA